jgi:hypothetical protein
MLPALVLAFALSAGAPDGAPPEVPLVTWEELCARPSRWAGKTVHVRIQYQDPVANWNPYLTRFSSSRFVAIQAWADEQIPWVKTEYDTPVVRLFALRDGPCAWAFQSARKGDRFEVTIVVREVFLALPWAEVTEVVPLLERIGEGTVIHAGRAIELMNRQAWKLAELEIDQAITIHLPERARAELQRMKEQCQEASVTARRPKRSTVGVTGGGVTGTD